MATDRLSIYNIGLAALGERSVASLNEDREPRHLLDEIWTRGNGAIRYCLEQGLWNHAMRAVQLDKSPSVSPSFGYANAFDMPTDFVRLVSLSAGEYFDDPLMRYEIETGFIYSDVDPIFMRYVSDDTDFGNDLSLWPETFTMWVGHYLATQVAPRLKNDIDMESLLIRTNRYLVDARSKDAQQEPTRWPPIGSWSRSRYGYSHSGRGDRGSRGSFTG